MHRLMVFAILGLSACASSQKETATVSQTQTVRVTGGGGTVAQLPITVSNRTHTVTVPHSVEELWRALPGVYQTLGITVNQLNTTTRTIGNSSFNVRRQLGGVVLSRYFDCGRTQDRPSAETYELQVSVLTHLESGEAGATAVRTSLQATARPVNFASGVVQCTSTGALESRIVEALKAQVQG